MRLDHLARDLRFAARIFRRSPIVTAAAIVTIALGVGANAAIFSAVNAVVLRPLPFPNPDRLYALSEENAARGWYHQMVSTANYLDWRDGVSAFENLAAYDYASTSETLSGLGESRRVRVVFVTGNLFSTLGARAAIGRTLVDDETWDTTPATLVLSDAMWTREFGRDPRVIGRLLTLDGEPTRVVGVMPASFAFPYQDVDVWVTFRWKAARVRSAEMWRRERWLHVVGRLRSGISLGAATAQLGAVTRRLAHDYPSTNMSASASIIPLHDFLIGDRRIPLLVLLGAVAVLLLIACGNVASLLLAQTAGRQRELALRLALGAMRGRLVRQIITESLLLSTVSACLGAVLGWAGTKAFVALQPAGLLPVRSFDVDATVLVYVALIAAATGVVFGVAPALWIQRRDPADVLKATSRASTEGGGLRRWADAMAAGEVALALLLTIGATLLVESARHLANVDPGFDARGVLVTSYSLYSHAYDSPAPRDAFHRAVLDRVRHLPGVTHAAFGMTPLEPNLWRSGVVIRGQTSTVEVPHMYASPDWPATLGIPLRRGRFYTAEDRADPTRIVINETFAKMFFPGEDPIGKQFSVTKRDYGPPVYTVIGVIADIHETSLIDTPGPLVVDQFQEFGSATLLVRSNGDALALARMLRAVILGIDPQIAPSTIRPLAELRDREMARTRFFAVALVAFAVVGLVLAAVGIYGVLAQLTRSRAREMGIRIALGARPAEVRWLVVRHGAMIGASGLAGGTIIALATTHVLASLLFGVPPNDPRSLGLVALLLGATSVVASWVPAWRASRADPMDVLRAE